MIKTMNSNKDKDSTSNMNPFNPFTDTNNEITSNDPPKPPEQEKQNLPSYAYVEPVIPHIESDTDDDMVSDKSSTPAPVPPPSRKKTYNFSSALFYKTSDRILDDLRNDPLYLLRKDSTLNPDQGILNTATVDYASSLSTVIKSSSTRYEALTLSTNLEYLNSKSLVEIPETNGEKLWTFNGIIVPKYSVQIPKSPIFHYKIYIKGKENTSHLKHKFYSFKDDQLLDEDKDLFIISKNDVLQSRNLESADQLYKYNTQILLDSLPKILDSANFVCQKTGTVVRLEIYPPILDSNDLKEFQDEEIEIRTTSFLSQLDDSVAENFHIETPSTLDCFSILFRVLKGPFDNYGSKDRKTLKPDASAALRLNLKLSMLIDKFFFRYSFETGDNELEPPSFAQLGEYEFLCTDYYRRSLMEILYLGSIFAPNPKEYFKTRVNFSSNFLDIFQALNESDAYQQIENWEKWSDYQYSPSFTLLSSCSFYSDKLIIDSYNRLCSYNPKNIPQYFDALTFCATSRSGQELQIYVSTLRSQGVIGLGELKGYFQKLGFDPTNNINIINTLSDDQIIEAYKNNIVLSQSKYEKTTLRQSLEKLASYRSSSQIRDYLITEPYFDIADAYDYLDVTESIEDEVLITAYQFKIEENPNYYDPNVSRALVSIALTRKSLILMNYIDSNLPQFAVPNITLQDAYWTIGCTDQAEDTLIIRMFQERMNKDTGTDFRVLWKSLKIIGDYRRSKLIEGFLASGIIDSTLLAVDKSPAGLNNIGNTCYLNSLLQYYFVIEPLRSYVLNFNKVFRSDIFNQTEAYKKRRIGGRTVGLKETERSYQFMYQLRDLYSRLIHENSRCVTPTRELAYLAFSPISVEVEFENEDEKEKEKENKIGTEQKGDADAESLIELTHAEFESELKDKDVNMKDAGQDNHPDKDKKVEDDTTELKCSAFASRNREVYCDEPDTPDTSEDVSNEALDNQIEASHEIEKKPQKMSAAVCKISPDQFDTAFEIGSQQDVTECISNVLLQIESAMEPNSLDSVNEQLDMIKELFYGKTKQNLVPVDPVTKETISNREARTKEERFLNLIVNIGDHPKDIYDALDTYFTEDLLQLDEEEVKRSLTITQLPNILQIQIQRVQFDRVRLIPVKSNEPLPFEENLYMDRYMETDDEVIISKRKQVFHWRRRVEELNARKESLLKKNEQGLNVKEVLDLTRQFLRSQTINEIGIVVDMNTLEVLDREVAKLDNELADISNELANLHGKINKQFKGFNKIGYSIFAIFIHRGQASYGHYWIYIKDPKANIYRKYNDEIISEVTLEEILNFSEVNTATPYYLVFVKDELIDRIDPLKRDIVVEEIFDNIDVD